MSPAYTPPPPAHPAPTTRGRPKRWYHQWTFAGQAKSEARSRPPRRWRVVMAMLPWRVRMVLLRRWAKR